MTNPDSMLAAMDRPWEEPLPLGWHTDLPDFPVAELPSVISRYAKAISAEIQVPASLCAPVALGVLSAAVGGRVRVWVRPGWEEPTNLYVVPVADPASRKSAVVAECRIPLDVAERELREQLADEVANSITRREVLEAYAEKVKKKAGQSGKAADIAEAQDAVRSALAVEVLAYPRLTTQDATPEALIGLLAEQGGRIAAISPEAGIFDSLIGRYASKTNLEPILMAHAGDSILVDRRTRAPERVDKPALTLIASIQPFALRDLVSRPDFAGRGLLARVLWSLPADWAGTRGWEVEPAPEYVKRAFRALICDLAMTVGLNTSTVTLTLTDPAYKLLGEYYLRVEPMLRRDGELGSGLCKPWGGKLVGAAVRIAGCLHAAEGPDALGARIGEDTMRSAIAIAEYFRLHAIAALSPADDSRTQDARIILELLIAKGLGTFTLRELQRRLPRRLQKAEIISPLLKYLEALGFVRLGAIKGYELHPDADAYLTPADSADSADNGGISAGHGDFEAVSIGADTADTPVVLSAGVSGGADALGNASTSTNGDRVSAVSAVSTIHCSVCGQILDPALAPKWQTARIHPRCQTEGAAA